MSPLDLTRRPPRSPEEELRGVCMLPRMIDIARARVVRESETDGKVADRIWQTADDSANFART